MKGLIGPQIAQPHPARRAQPRILVVDDEKEMRELVALHLRNAGYSVDCAEDAVAAGHCVATAMPDLIVCDFKMPFMDGVEFIAALRADATIRDIPVVFMTGAEHRAELAGRTFGFPLLTKPMLSDDLITTVAAQLRRLPSPD